MRYVKYFHLQGGCHRLGLGVGGSKEDVGGNVLVTLGPCGRLTATVLLIALLVTPYPNVVRAGYQGPSQIAVLELHRRGTPSEYTRKTTDRFREELTRYDNLTVLSRDECQEILKYHRLSIRESGKVTPIQSLVAESKQAYFQMEFDRTKRLSAEAIKKSLQVPPHRRDYRSLLEAYTMQGIVFMSTRQGRESKKSFRQVVYYNPDVSLDKRYFAPAVIKKLRRAKEAAQQETSGRITVTSRPKSADVYVNGVFHGTAPLELSGFQTGEHVITVKASNYGSRTRVVNVKEGQITQVRVSLDWRGPSHSHTRNIVGFRLEDYADLEELIAAAAAAADEMRVQKLILIDLQHTNGKDQVQAYVVDRRLATFHRPQTIVTNNIKEESAQTSAVLARQVLDEMDESIMKDPQAMAAAPYYGDIVLVGKKQKSFLKSPWFWVAIGSVVAGGAAAGVAASGAGQGVGAIDVLFR